MEDRSRDSCYTAGAKDFQGVQQLLEIKQARDGFCIFNLYSVQVSQQAQHLALNFQLPGT